jgi:hypothetical protein
VIEGFSQPPANQTIQAMLHPFFHYQEEIMFKPSRHTLGMAAALTVLSCLPIHAQESGVVGDLKVRTAWSPSPQDHLSGTSLGFGLNFAWDTKLGQAGVEVGYYYKTGDDYFLGPNGSRLPAGLQAPDPANSGDARRNQLDGFALRLSLQRKLVEDWDWQAGLMIGGTRFRHEYKGQIESVNWANDGSGGTDTWADTYSGVKTESGMAVSPYIGLTWNMTKRSSLEFNLMALSYKAVEYVHYAGTSPSYDANQISAHNNFPGDGFVKSTRYVPHLEFGYVFHF